jgi:OOP family OmpA-OmpF porin
MKARRFVVCFAVASAACGAGSALAQSAAVAGFASSAGASSVSLLPAKGRASVGLTLGRSRYTIPCGATAITCDNASSPLQLSAGNQVGNFWGVELAYIDMGRMARGIGTTRAQGLNVSLFAKAPVWQSVGVFGKFGTTYGRTEISAAGSNGVASGSERGFGLSYGAGVSYDFTPRLSATLAWDSHDFRFPGTGRDAIRSTSLGLQYRY